MKTVFCMQILTPCTETLEGFSQMVKFKITILVWNRKPQPDSWGFGQHLIKKHKAQTPKMCDISLCPGCSHACKQIFFLFPWAHRAGLHRKQAVSARQTPSPGSMQSLQIGQHIPFPWARQGFSRALLCCITVLFRTHSSSAGCRGKVPASSKRGKDYK